MKAFRSGLLEPWPGDSGPVTGPTAGSDAPTLAGLLERLPAELGEIRIAVEAIRPGELDDEILDSLYRRSHVAAAFAEILGIRKLDHLLALLEATLDIARELRDFEGFALAYLARLLSETSVQVIRDFQAGSTSQVELADLVSECANYLARAAQTIEMASAKQASVAAVEADEPAPAAAAASVTATGPARAQAQAAVATASPPTVPLVPFDDTPEDLDIPPDRVGLLGDFCEEARENLDRVGRKLVELEGAADPREIVNDLFRAVHTVKGGARMLRMRKLEKLAHEMESCLDEIRGGRRSVTPTLIDLFLSGHAVLAEMVEEAASRGPIRTLIAPLLTALANLGQPGATTVAAAAVADSGPAARPAAAALPPTVADSTSPAVAGAAKDPPGAASKSVGADTIRIATGKLDEVLNTASEIFISRIRLQSDLAVLRSAVSDLATVIDQGGVDGDAAALARMRERDRRIHYELQEMLRHGNLQRERSVEFLRLISRQLEPREAPLGTNFPGETSLYLLSMEQARNRLEKSVELLQHLSTRLQQGAMSFRMVPIASLFSKFPTQVRNIARQVDKLVRLDIEGEDTQLDKVLIGQLADPLLHLLRNSLDHGIESPAERRAAGKDEVGRILLRASYEGSHAVIEIKDDGRGIDLDRVLARAIERGLVDAQRATQLDRSEILNFIFEPGFSTAAKVSELSGRGVGMDVVRTSVQQVQGTVSLDSQLGKGARVTIRLPLTLAVVWIVLVEEGQHRFAFPLLDVDAIVTIRTSEITELAIGSVVSYRGRTLPLTRLSSLLGFAPGGSDEDRRFIVVLSEGNRQVGVLVDAIVGRQQVLIKNLGGLIKRVPFVIGCTILSDSRLVLILNPREVVSFSARSAVQAVSAAPADQMQAKRRRQTVLVIDDSGIQRKYLHNALDRAGYTVELSENGFEALRAVRKKRYAACLVDIVMPLMDGFEFVERMRKMREVAALPVYFVTSRSDPTDRDRAQSLGAAGFFTKPVDCDQLIAVLDRATLVADEAVVRAT